MDLVYWNEFCRTYDIKYLDKLSENTKLLLKDIINKNIKFKGLQRILYLYFNKIDKITIKCNVIASLMSLSYHISPKYNKYIYIFGENHFSQSKCNVIYIIFSL